MATYTAVYTIADTFELDFDLKDVFKWYIKWGVLRVTHKEGDDEIEIHPDFCATDDPQFKHPNSVVDEDGHDVTAK